MNEKGQRYRRLVERVKKEYKHKEQECDNEMSWCDLVEGEDLCHEINLWTYWQGWNYANEHPEIKILLIGQDFGPPKKEEKKGTIKNVRRLNAGDSTAMFQQGIKLKGRDAQTDNALVTLFEEIGYPEIDKIRYRDLFFCNFCLGYRKEKYTGNLRKKDFRADRESIKELVDILEPEHIICLGADVSIEIIKLLCDCDYSDKPMDQLIDLDKIQNYKGTQIHPMAHPGFWGARNRGGIEKLKEDWVNALG